MPEALVAPTTARSSGPIKVVGVIEEAVTSPRNDGTRGSVVIRRAVPALATPF